MFTSSDIQIIPSKQIFYLNEILKFKVTITLDAKHTFNSIILGFKQREYIHYTRKVGRSTQHVVVVDHALRIEQEMLNRVLAKDNLVKGEVLGPGQYEFHSEINLNKYSNLIPTWIDKSLLRWNNYWMIEIEHKLFIKTSRKGLFALPVNKKLLVKLFTPPTFFIPAQQNIPMCILGGTHATNLLCLFLDQGQSIEWKLLTDKTHYALGEVVNLKLDLTTPAALEPIEFELNFNRMLQYDKGHQMKTQISSERYSFTDVSCHREPVQDKDPLSFLYKFDFDFLLPVKIEAMPYRSKKGSCTYHVKMIIKWSKIFLKKSKLVVQIDLHNSIRDTKEQQSMMISPTKSRQKEELNLDIRVLRSATIQEL